MKIIDSHTHIGFWNEENDYTREDLLMVLNSNQVEYFVVSNLDGIGIDPSKPDNTPLMNEKDSNEMLIRVFKKYPQAILLAVCEPRHGNPKTIRLLLGQNKKKFSGLKFHPEANKIPANSELYDGYMKIAEDNDLPCLFHSGDLKSNYSSPELIYELAQRHPKVKVILGHLSAGDDDSKERAIEIMEESVQKNNCILYTDISWCKGKFLIDLIKKLPNNIDRILFGSDAPMMQMGDPMLYNYMINELFIAPLQEAFKEKSEDLIKKVFYDNAKQLFKIK